MPAIAIWSLKRGMLSVDMLGTALYLAATDRNLVTGQTLNVDDGEANL